MNPDRFAAAVSEAELERYKSLGPLQWRFGPSIANAIVGVILGVMAIGGGGYAIFTAAKAVVDSHGQLPWQVEGRWCWLGVGFCSLLGIFGIATGLFLIYFGRFIFQQRVCICEGGVWRFDGKKLLVFPWSEVISIRVDLTRDHLPINSPIKYALPAKESRSYWITRQDGVQIYLSKNEISKMNELAELLKSEAERRNIPFQIS